MWGRAGFILGVEGNVCAGKTTLAQHLAEENRWTFIPEYWELMSRAERDTLDRLPLGRRLSILMEIENERHAALWKGDGDFVLDRTILTILVTHRVLAQLEGRPISSAKAEWLLSRKNYWRPHLTVYLDVPDETLDARWRQRSKGDAVFVDPQFRSTFRALFKKLCDNHVAIWIDANRRSVRDIAENIREYRERSDDVVDITVALRVLDDPGS